MSRALKKHESISGADETLTGIAADAYRLTNPDHTPEGGFAQMAMQTFRLNIYAAYSRQQIAMITAARFGYDVEFCDPLIKKALSSLVRRGLLRSRTERGERIYELAY